MQPHIHLDHNARYQRALVCGSPERAKKFADYLQNSALIAQHREYHSYLGTYQGHEVLIVSHGVGAAGAAICFQELINVGVRTIVRVGTAGGLYDGLNLGDVVVATSAVRQDGVSRLMIDIEFPAVADLEVTQSLLTALRAQGWAGRSGVVVTSDLFYPGLLNEKFADLELFAKASAIAVEMECSTLFIIGQLRGVRTGAALVCDGNPLKWKEGFYDPNPTRLAQSMNLAMNAALQTLIQY